MPREMRIDDRAFAQPSRAQCADDFPPVIAYA
jgi:hypothetical protein